MAPQTFADISRDDGRQLALFNKARSERAVLNVLAAYPDGLTAEEIEVKTGMGLLTIRPRLTELTDSGVLIACGRRKRPGQRCATTVRRLAK